jgi:hypothetical protein
MRKKKREFWVGENRFYLGEDNIFYVTQSGNIDDKIAINVKEKISILLSSIEGKVNWLVDLNASGKQSPQARTFQREITEHEKTRKCVLLGVHPVARVIAAFSIGISQNKDLRFFKAREEALTWLKE